MNKQKFIAYLRKPGDLDEQSIDNLQQLVAEYPYFQSARTLLAKAAKQNKSKSTPRIINSAAVYATDRVLLKKYLNDELIFLQPIEVHESHEAERERDLSDALKTSRRTATQKALKQREIEEKELEEKRKKAEERAEAAQKETEAKATAEKAVEKTKPDAKESPQEVSDYPSSELDSIIEELYQDLEDLKVNRAKFREIEEQLAEDEAVNAAVEKAQNSVKKEPVKKPAESRSARRTTKLTKEEPKKEEIKKEEKKPAAKKATKKTTASKSSGAKKSSSTTAAKKTTSSTKKSTTTKKAATKKTTATTRKSSAAKKSTPKKAASKKSDEGGDSKKEDKGDPQKKKKEQDSIIENFIKTNPSIPPPDGSESSSVDLADESVQLHPEVASEYLAEIYLEQGKKDRAIEIYQSLILKFPQKKSYFAGLIENLK